MSKETENPEVETESTETPETEVIPAVDPDVQDQGTEETPEQGADTEAEEVSEEETTDFDPEKWGQSENETINSVLQLLHEGGADPAQAKALLFEPIREGKLDNIDKEALIEMVGKARANLIMTGVSAYVKEQTETTNAAVNAVYEAAGGEEAWKTMLPWINKLPEAEKAEFREMIDLGGASTRLAIRELKQMYNADPKNKTLGKAEDIKGDSNSTKQEPGISSRQYGDELNLLVRKGMATPEARARLKARRALGKKQGL